MKSILAITCLLVAVAIASAQEWAWPVLARQASQRQVRSSALTDTPQYEHLVGWWLPRGLAPQADESGAFLRDWSQSGNYMTQSQANAIAPIVNFGNVWAWRGTNQNIGSGGDFLQTVATNILDGANEITYMAFLHMDFIRANAGVIFSHNAGSILYGQRFRTSANPDQIVFLLGPVSNFGPRPKTNSWIHVAAIFQFQQSNWTVNIYTNGLLSSAATANFTNKTITINAPWQLGRGQTNSVEHNFAGGIMDVRLYNAALSSNEVYSASKETTHE
jgi:hypothetical protein